MKLNNRGFGIQVMMVFVLILMICLVIIATLLNNNLDKLGINNYDYTKLEEKVNNAAKEYIEQKQITFNNTYTVTVKELQNEKLLDEISDKTNKCTGYNIVKKNSDKITYNAYIKCGSNYETKNYSSNLDK